LREHSLIAFGGAGGIHAAALAQEMEMHEVIVPIAAGLFSSLGLLFADTAVARVAAHHTRLGPSAHGEIEARAATLTAEAVRELQERHRDGERPTVEVLLSLRYVGQSATLTLPYLPSENACAVATVAAAFHREHERAYGQAAADEPIEVTAIRARARRPAPPLSFAEIAAHMTVGAPPAPTAATAPARRELFFGRDVGTHDAPVLARGDLAAASVAGPLVVEDAEATILVPPGFLASLHATGSIVLRPQR
jgi:N-methylhydantoinase A